MIWSLTRLGNNNCNNNSNSNCGSQGNYCRVAIMRAHLADNNSNNNSEDVERKQQQLHLFIRVHPATAPPNCTETALPLELAADNLRGGLLFPPLAPLLLLLLLLLLQLLQDVERRGGRGGREKITRCLNFPHK